MGNLADYTISEIILKVDNAFKSNPILTKLGEIEGKKLEKFTMGRKKGEYTSIANFVPSTMFSDRTKRSGFSTKINKLTVLAIFDLLNIIELPCMICKLPYSSRLGCNWAEWDDEVYAFQGENERLCIYCVFAFSIYNLGTRYGIEILDELHENKIAQDEDRIFFFWLDKGEFTECYVSNFYKIINLKDDELIRCEILNEKFWFLTSMRLQRKM